jgi:lauroyl/myristoyl acyltransferase
MLAAPAGEGDRPLVVEVSGWDIVEAAWQRGGGILFITPHLGCFEITAQYSPAHAPITVLYRRQSRPWLQPVIEPAAAGRTCTWRRPISPACAVCSRP